MLTDTQRLLEMIRDSIAGAVPMQRIGVAFSGGVDSALISKICSDMDYDVTLLTIGFPGSHDLLFANKVNELLQFQHRTLEIDSGTFPHICSKIRHMINTQNLSWNENCIAFYYVSELAKKLGIDTVVAANGIDELFCGYDAYRSIFSQGDSGIMDAMDAKLENELGMMRAVSLVSSEFGVQLVQPLLSPKFVKYAKTVPVSEKIHGPDDLLRKHIVRRLASKIGVPEMSHIKRKKALQYGSGIHKMLLKTM